MNDATTPTLRRYMTTPLPDADSDEMQRLLADALRYAGLVIAASTDYFSDSTLDSHNQVSECIIDLINLIYGHDQTMTNDEALDLWLDNEDCFYNMNETAGPNFTATPDEPLPALWSHFDFDTYWEN
jgi:hypothetical protein